MKPPNSAVPSLAITSPPPEAIESPNTNDAVEVRLDRATVLIAAFGRERKRRAIGVEPFIEPEVIAFPMQSPVFGYDPRLAHGRSALSDMLHIHGRLHHVWLKDKGHSAESREIARLSSELWTKIVRSPTSATHMTPGDDSWMARLLRSRLEQDTHETPPEWSTWIHGFKWDIGRKSFHLREKDEFGHDALWKPKNTKRRGYLQSKPLWDDGLGRTFKAKIQEGFEICSPLSNASATWKYRDHEEIIAEKHGLIKFIFRQDKPFPKDSKTIHVEELQEMRRFHTIKTKGNTSGWQPLLATKGELNTDVDWNQEIMRREPRFVDEASSSTEVEWTGDDLIPVADKPEYFQGRVISPKVRLTGAQRAEAFNDHKNLVEAGAVDLREDEIVLEIILENKTVEEGAEELGTTKEALWKRMQRRNVEALTMRDKNKWIPHVALAQEQAEDIVSRGAVYLLVKVNGWKWYKLDVKGCGSIDATIESLKANLLSEALRQRPEYKVAGKRGLNRDNPRWTKAFVETKRRFDVAFEPDHRRVVTLPEPRPRWAGVLSDLADGGNW